LGIHRSTAPRLARTVQREAEGSSLPDRRLRKVAQAGLIAILAGLAPAIAHAQQAAPMPLAVRAAPHDGYGRIVFEGAKPIGFNATLEDNVLVVRFDHPASAALAPLARRLADYVGGAPLAIDGQVARIPLKRAVTVRTFTEGPAMVVDLVNAKDVNAKDTSAKDASSKQTSAKDTGAKDTSAAPKASRQPTPSSVAAAAAASAPAPTSAPAPVSAQPTSSLAFRVGEHPDHSRLVFDVEQPAAYELEVDGGVARLRIATSSTLVPLKGELPARVSSIYSQSGANGLSIRVGLADGATVKHFRSGTKIVVDVFGPAISTTARAAAPKPTVAKASSVPQSQPQSKTQTQPASPASVGAPTPLLPGKASAATATTATPVAAKVVDPASIPAGPRVPVVVTRADAVATLRFSWPQDVAPAAAVFTRAGYLWAVFDRDGQLDFSRWGRNDGAPDARRPAPGVTVFRLKLADPDLVPVAARDGAEWIVTLAPDAKRPQGPAVEVRKDNAGRTTLFVAVAEPGPTAAIADPDVGDTLIVVPLARAGLGIGAERRYAEMRLLPSAQGLVVEALADGITAQSAANGVEFAAASGLKLSADARAEAPAKSTRIFDFEAWRKLGGGGDDARLELQNAVLQASAPQRNARRLDLARFHFARAAYPETLGVIEAIASDQRDAAEEPEVKAIRGAARLQMNDVAGASNDLMSPVFDGEREVAPWRGALAAAQRDWAGALRQFVRGESVLDRYPPALRIQFALAAAEAALEAGDPARARVHLQQVAALSPTGGAAERAAWLNARSLAAFQEYDAADAEWKRAMRGGDPWVRSRARFDRADTLLAAGKITRPEAISELEKLEFAWRGDAFEYRTLKTLGELQIAEGDLRKGLTTLRKAVTNFQGQPDVGSVTSKMREAFIQFHADGRAAKMPTVTALGVFMEFRDLVPDGPVGDDIMGELVRRLVDVDLLDRAEEILADLADRRLNGSAESKARNQLGLVYLMDRKPAKALEALDRPLAADVDDETIAARRQLKARALTDLDHPADALKLLAADDTPEGANLRADLFWRIGEWKQAAAAFAPLTARIDPAKMSESDTRLVMRKVIALALAGDGRALATENARFGAGIAATPYKDAFAMLTDPQQINPVNIRAIAGQISTADRFGAFLDSYRARLIKTAPAPKPGPTAAAERKTAAK
jgi:tetratricopeptide (TPR) repeat protein